MNEIPKQYIAENMEPEIRYFWDDNKIYRFQPGDRQPVFAIDTPPPTVSGDLHMGHCYSYSQTDFYARFRRMNGSAVFYPMGWDDNGLPTERLVEKRLGITPEKTGTEAYLKAVTETSRQLEKTYEHLWKSLGLSIDWRYNYSTISPAARKAAQYSFLDLLKKERIYRSAAPAIYCPSCKTAISHAEVSDITRQTNFITISFSLDDDQILPVATTRPELLPACVAIFIHPDDIRYRHLLGSNAWTPIFNKEVPILADYQIDPAKGTGAVMCCTFGDAMDIKWWREHNLPLVNVLTTDGCLNTTAGFLAGLDIKTARRRMIEELKNIGKVLATNVISQTVSVHERCETPVEYLETKQWFIRLLDKKEDLLAAGDNIVWHPAYMKSRYEDWVKHLEWDWCISRQRYHGVPFPVWYCTKCGAILTAKFGELPIDPRTCQPEAACQCGSHKFKPETSVMDTWMTSSVSPQIAAGWPDNETVYNRVFPMSLRPQAHDIIRTWTFYTVVKSLYHFGKVPWSDIAISGHGLSPEGHKVSKSRGNSIIEPLKVMRQYSADAIRYWAACAKLGEDSIINEEKIASGQRLVTKLWNVALFSRRFLENYKPPEVTPALIPTDAWVLSRLQQVISEVTIAFAAYDHASAKSKIESFFWDIIADNYLEMVKTRLYDLPANSMERESARYTLYHSILSVLKLLAPFLPFITEKIYQVCYREYEKVVSVHVSQWPVSYNRLIKAEADSLGEALITIASATRRYKSEKQLPMGTPLEKLMITVSEHVLFHTLQQCRLDIMSVTRAKNIVFNESGETCIGIMIE